MILGCTVCPDRGECGRCDTGLFRRRMFELCENCHVYGQERITTRMNTYAEAMAAAEDWLSASVFDEAVADCIRLGTGDMLTARQFLEVCRQVDNAQKRDGDDLALPEPEATPLLSVDPKTGEVLRPPAVDREFWNRWVATGRAIQRERKTRILEWRAAQRQPFGAVPAGVLADTEPTPEAIQAVLREMVAA